MNHCPKCESEVKEGMKFCGNCGNKLSTVAKTDRERRRVTVLFSDLVEFTEFSVSVEDDDVPEVLEIYQDVVRTCVTRWGGHVAQFLGDGVLVYFGYPNALENTSERAIQAGLDIIRNMELICSTSDLNQQVRVGIHHGSGVMTDVGEDDRLLVGNTPNIAARMQSVAEPNTVVVSKHTYDTIEDLFDCEDLGLKYIKGLQEELGVYRIISHKEIARIEIERARGLGILAGRDTELAWLHDNFDSARTQGNRSLLISGDAGMGKSRLLHEFQQETSTSAAWITQRCSEYRQDTPLDPIKGILKNLIGIGEFQEGSEHGQLISDFLKSSGMPIDPYHSLLQDFLSIGSSSLPSSDNAIERLLIDITSAGTASMPLIVLLEDIHWVDRSTLSLLQKLLEVDYAHPLIVIKTTRPMSDIEELHGFNVHELLLESLSADGIHQILVDRLAHPVIRAEVVEFMTTKSGGNPLYVEGLVNVLVDENLLVEVNGQLQLDSAKAYRIPNTLHDSLAMRIDKLGNYRRIAQIASSLGREFDVELLKSMLPDEHAEIDETMALLEELDLVVTDTRTASSIRYVFQHDLIRDVIYDSMLRQQRVKIHQQVATTLEDSFPSIATQHPELLGLHWHQAGEGEKAIRHYENACQRFTEQGAHAEATKLCRTALDVIPELDDSNDKDRVQLNLLLMLAAGMNSTSGYASPEKYTGVLEPALDLIDKLEIGEESIPLFYGAWSQQLAQADKEKTEYWRDRIVNLVSSQNLPMEPHTELAAKFSVATTAFWEADFQQSIDGYDDLMSKFESVDHKIMMRNYGEDILLYARTYRQWAYLFCGQVDRAREHAKQSLDIAESMNDPQALVNCIAMTNHIFRDLGEIEIHLENAERLISLAEKHGFSYYYVVGYVQRNWALARLGREQEQMGTLSLNLEAMELMMSALCRDQAELFLLSGEFDQGLATIDYGMTFANVNLDVLYMPDILRVKGDLLLANGDRAGAETNLRAGLKLAQDYGENYWAVKCAVQLALLLHESNRLEARSILASELRAVEGFGDCILYNNAKQTLAELDAKIR